MHELEIIQCIDLTSPLLTNKNVLNILTKIENPIIYIFKYKTKHFENHESQLKLCKEHKKKYQSAWQLEGTVEYYKKIFLNKNF